MVSIPHRIHWAGFETTTVAMWRSGWEISAKRFDYDLRIALAFRHNRLRIRAFTNPIEVRPALEHTHIPLDFQIANMAHEIEVARIQTSMDFSEFSPIGARPQFIEYKTLDQFNIFAPLVAPAEEIIVEPQTVAEMLARIKEMQAPTQAEIRDRQRRREASIKPVKIHAQILSFPKAA